MVRGFVWFQGWNDMYDEDARVHARTTRASHRGCTPNTPPRLPVIIGELGNGGPEASDKMPPFAPRNRRRVAAGAAGNVKFISTSAFARPKDESPNVGHGQLVWKCGELFSDRRCAGARR